jgi:RNA polymerase sigma-70 factor, ECF subfamily
MLDRDKFLTRFLRAEADIKAFIGSLVLDPHLRDDVFQEVALALWQQMEAYDPSRSFGAWARGIAANKILQAREKNARFPLVFSPETIRAVLDAFDQTEATASRKAEALRDCLKQLPGKSRQLLDLRYEQELKNDEIARRSKSTLDAIYQALSRIRQKLEECIRRKLALEGGRA